MLLGSEDRSPVLNLSHNFVDRSKLSVRFIEFFSWGPRAELELISFCSRSLGCFGVQCVLVSVNLYGSCLSVSRGFAELFCVGRRREQEGRG